VENLTFAELGPTSMIAIGSWEKANAPYVLPVDLKAFLQFSDGLNLRWDARLNGIRASPAVLRCG